MGTTELTTGWCELRLFQILSPVVPPMPEQLVQTADSIPTDMSPLECRVHTRNACELPATCLPTSSWGRKEAQWPATITDLSVGGVRLIVRRRFEPGSGLGVELPGHDGEEPYTGLAKVVRVCALPDGSWALGCKFISELSEDELQGLLNLQQQLEVPPIAPSQHARASLSDVTFEIEVPDGSAIPCRVRHLTIPGSWPLAAGKLLTLQGPALRGPLASLRLKVLRSAKQGERWTVRCQLLNPPTHNLLRALRGPGASGRR